jgi:LmbE family N-acetylglucosaminyl deacetylase
MKVLVLGPHTDDAEFGCGATMAKFLEQGAEVVVLAFSSCEQSVPAPFPPDALAKESAKSLSLMGIPSQNYLLENFPVRNFGDHRQAILEKMVKVRKELAPGLVFAPCLSDTHQDHQVVAQECFRAFKSASVYGYELPWNNITFSNTTFSIIEERHLAVKIRCIECYETQRFRDYASPEMIKSLATVRGVQCSRKLAEAFETYRTYL